MPFDVRITFDGLYLLAVQAEPPLVHALLVSFGEDSPCCDSGSHALAHTHDDTHDDDEQGDADMATAGDHPKHFGMLYFDAAHNALQEEDRKRLTGHLYGVPLGNRLVRFDGASPPVIEFEPAILDIKEIAAAAESIDKKFVGPGAGRAVGGRVTLATGQAAKATRIAEYDVIPSGARKPAKQVKITTRVEWEINGVDAADFRVEVRDLETEKVLRTHVLLPVEVTETLDDGTTQKRRLVQIHVYCAPASDLPGSRVMPPKKFGDPIPHLAGFFQFFPGVDAPTLTLRGERTGSTEQCTGVKTTAR